MISAGINNIELNEILSIFQNEGSIDEAILFGSRAKGNFKNNSDVDIALLGPQIDYAVISHVSYLLNEESLLPYKFDILNFNSIENKDLKDHILRIGISIYRK